MLILQCMCKGTHSFDADLYEQLNTFPQDLLPALDQVVNNYAAADRNTWVRPFNLLLVHIKSMRNMNPIDPTPPTRNKRTPRTTLVEST